VKLNANVPPIPATGALVDDKFVVHRVGELKSIFATNPEPPVVPSRILGGAGWNTPAVVGKSILPVDPAM
jgi:hypothetical protein